MRQPFLLTLIALLAPAWLVARPAASRGVAHRALVWVPGESRPGLASRLGRGWKVLDSWNELFVVGSERRLGPEQIRLLKRVPGVLAVERDRLVTLTEQDTHAGGRAGPAPAPANRPPAAQGCPLLSRCPNGNARYWAQTALGADLMRTRIKALQADGLPVKVAVIDSGLDTSQVSHFKLAAPVRTERGAEVGESHPIRSGKPALDPKDPVPLGDPAIDENGHGTAVASVIAGEGAMGFSDNVALAVYRVTAPGDGGSTTSSILETALYKACEQNKDPEGITLINLSWGGRTDEEQLTPDEKDEVKQRLAEKLAAEGCLVVKSAGNSSFRHDREADLDDAFLRVAAVDPTLRLTDFSSVGEIAAPGQDLYVIESSGTRSGKNSWQDRGCGAERHRRFIDGTSFAAPLIAALGSQVTRVLKRLGGFVGIEPRDRIRLVSRILKASMQFGSANALRAEVIAELWAGLKGKERARAFAPDGPEFLTSLLKRHPDPVCGEKTSRCAGRACGELRQCMSRGRERLALCPEISPDEILDLSLTAFQNDGFELGYLMSHGLKRIGKSTYNVQMARRQAIEDFKAKVARADGYSSSPLREITPNFLQMVVAPFVQTGNYVTPAEMEDIARNTLLAYRIHASLNRGVDPETGEDRGSGPTLDAVATVAESGRKMLGDHRFARIIDDFIDGYNKRVGYSKDYNDTPFPVTQSAAGARILDRLLQSAPKGSRTRKALLAAEAKLLAAIRELNQYYAPRTQKVVLGSETYPSRSAMNLLLARHEKQILKEVTPGLLYRLAPVEMAYVLDHPDRFTSSPGALGLRVLETIAANYGWGPASNPEIAEKAMIRVADAMVTAPEKEKAKIRERFRKLVTEAQSPELVGGLLDLYWSDKAYGVDALEAALDLSSDKEARKKKRSFQNHPLLDDAMVRLLSLKGVAYLQHADSVQLKGGAYPIDARHGLSGAWRGLRLPAELTQEVSQVVVPLSGEKPFSRLSQSHPKPRTVAVAQLSLDAAITSLARSALDREKGHEARDFLRIALAPNEVDLSRLPTLRRQLASLPQRGPWRDALESFASQTSSGWERAIESAKRFLALVDEAHRNQTPPSRP